MSTGSRTIHLRFFHGLAALLAGLATIAAAASWMGILDRTLTIAPSDILPRERDAYTVSLAVLPPALGFLELFYSGDSCDWPFVSTLRLRENGRDLGPSHSMHSDIAYQGRGRYSHWAQSLIFSASDNVDPRDNARGYEVTCSPNLLSLMELSLLSVASLALFLRLHLRMNQPASSAMRLIHRRLYRLTATRKFAWYRRAAILLAIFAAFSLELCISFYFGLTPWEDGDGWSYSRLADQLIISLRSWTALPVVSASTAVDCSSMVWLASCPADLLEWRDIYVFLFRMPGYPAAIAVSKLLTGAHWQLTIVVVQHALAVGAGIVVYRTAALISGQRLFGLISGVLFLLSHRLQYDRAILTDSLCTSGLTILLCWLVLNYQRQRSPSKLAFLFAGLCFVGLFFVRETGIVMAGAAFPLVAMVAWQARARSARYARLTAAYVPLCLAIVGVLGSNYVRTGYFFITTQPLSAGLYSAVLLENEGLPVFSGDSLLDRVARQTLQTHDFAETMGINKRLLLEYDLAAPAQSALIQQKYFSIWASYPFEMIGVMRDNISRQWQNLFIITELIDIIPRVYNAYCAVMSKWAWFCGIIAPLGLVIAGIFIKAMRRPAFMVVGLWTFAVVPTVAYSAFNIELRYLIFATGPLLLIFALCGRLGRLALLSLRASIKLNAGLRPNLLRDISGR